jgi:molybdopterin-guanine dinucleotide biosynthesis protein A
MSLAAIILVGGASSRMGVDKAALSWNGRGAVERLAALACEVGADRVLTAGGGDHGLERVDDPAPGGGPVSGIVAGIAALRATGHERVLVLAVDAATVRPGDLAPLLAAASPGAAYEGLNLPLVMDIAATPEGAGPGWAVGRLIERAGLARLACPAGSDERLRGANTPGERDRLLAALVEAETAAKGGAGC